MASTTGKRAIATILTTAALAAIVVATSVVAAPSSRSGKILSATHGGSTALAHPPSSTSVLSLHVGKGKWDITGKLWGDSVPSTGNPNTVVRCELVKGSSALDISVFNAQRTVGATSAGVIYLNAVKRFSSGATVKIMCDDINSNAQVHDVKLTAVKGS